MTKLINERTNEIVVFGDGIVDLAKIGCKNVAEMIEAGWKDYKEPEGIKSIEARYYKDENKVIIEYSSEEEARDAYDKVCAWKRLKDRHFKFDDYDVLNQTATWLVSREYDQYEDDIKLLFGGEK